MNEQQLLAAHGVSEDPVVAAVNAMALLREALAVASRAAADLSRAIDACMEEL